MAKGKKSRKSRTSLGVQGHPRKVGKIVTPGITRLNNQIKAWEQGKRVMVTIENPAKAATNARYIKVESREVWGLPPMERKNKVANAS